MTTTVAFAQTPPTGAQADQAKGRFKIAIMEGVLERAVAVGVEGLIRQVRTFTPDMLLLSGDARARGFRLDGYGVFFDVEVPALRRSVAWSLRAMIDQSGVPLEAALQQLRAYVRSVQDPRTKQSLEQALRRIELQVGPLPPPRDAVVPSPAASRSPARTTPPAVQQPLPPDASWVTNPTGAYTDAVKNALIEAMLEHSGPIGISADEWLTVAARDNQPADRFNPDQNLSMIILRVKGSDLAALRAGKLTLQEAKGRVEIKEN